MRKQIVLALVAGVILAATGIFYARARIQGISQEPTSQSQVEKCCGSAAAVIEGRVVNAEGQPVAGAIVGANMDAAGSSLEVTSRSDENGNYRIQVRNAGAYTMYASKEEDGYADTLSGFHQEGKPVIPKVNLHKNEIVHNIEVRLGSKAEHLEGIISEAITGIPISKATITLRRTDNPQLLYRIGAGEEKKNGKFQVLVPHGPFTIEVSSPGYETWTYSKDGSGNQPDSLKLNYGETKKLSIALRPHKQIK